MRTEKNNLLDENYRRSLKSTLMVVEKLLIEMEDLLVHGLQTFTLEIKDDVSAEIKTRNLKLIREARKQIGELADKYEIQKDIKGLQQMITVKKVKIWEVLSNSKTRRLKGFGELSRPGRDEFDRDIESLLEITEKIKV
jgi:hypothetical protein